MHASVASAQPADGTSVRDPSLPRLAGIRVFVHLLYRYIYMMYESWPTRARANERD